MSAYLVCGCKPWNRRVFDEVISKLPGEWFYAEDQRELDSWFVPDWLAAMGEGEDPPEWRYIFFLHWSWMVPPEIYEKYECVNFHMTDLPYGRGGSPLQNLIEAGRRETRITAHRMTGEVDCGPIYGLAGLGLHGTAEAVYVRATEMSAHLIDSIVANEPEPRPMRDPDDRDVRFTRRTPEQSVIPTDGTLDQLHDHIRMLDAEGYPHAFIEYGNLRLEFRRAALYDGRVEADVVITERAK